jgi:hypothetical protein
MKKNTIKILIVIVLVGENIICVGQSTEYSTENTKRIDAYLNGPAKANICDGVIAFPTKYDLSKAKSDAFITSFINTTSNINFTDNDADVLLKKIAKKASIKESLNGLIKVKNILLKGNYLRANIILEFIDNITVRTKVTLTTVTHAKCGMNGNSMLDFKILRDFFIKDAKMLFNVKYDEMIADTIYSDNLTLLTSKRKEYKFNIPGTSSENWVNNIFIKQYQADSSGFYNYSKAPKDFVKLIKENEISVIKDLLFSPNYFVSINAMEALLYLSSVNKVKLTTELNDKIIRIKNGAFRFLSQGAPDVFYIREGYKDLQMTDEKVFKKYSLSM